MKTINLKDYYDHLEDDLTLDIHDDVYTVLEEHRKAEHALYNKIYYHKAHLSLNRDDGIENASVFCVLSPEEIYVRKLTHKQLYKALANLPKKQAGRIYAHFFLHMSMTAIAKAEGVDKSRISRSIKAGITRIKKELKK